LYIFQFAARRGILISDRIKLEVRSQKPEVLKLEVRSVDFGLLASHV
jgi:hypothetical protein